MGRHDYYPFGTEIPRGGQADEPTKKYTGHERDPNGRADYMLGRTYLYPFMRFATPDPARDGWSLYAYTGNNPVNRIDPYGHFTLVVTTSTDSAGEVSSEDLREGSSLLLSLVPGVSDVKDAVEAIFGIDPVTGEELSGGDRAITVVAAMVPIVGGKLAREGVQTAIEGSDEVVDTTSFVGEPNGTLVDTQATPQGSYNQPDGGRTDILQGHASGAGYSHTHRPNRNTNPETGEVFNNGVFQMGTSVSTQDVYNIMSGVALRRPPLKR